MEVLQTLAAPTGPRTSLFPLLQKRNMLGKCKPLVQGTFRVGLPALGPSLGSCTSGGKIKSQFLSRNCF